LRKELVPRQLKPPLKLNIKTKMPRDEHESLKLHKLETSTAEKSSTMGTEGVAYSLGDIEDALTGTIYFADEPAEPPFPFYKFVFGTLLTLGLCIGLLSWLTKGFSIENQKFYVVSGLVLGPIFVLMFAVAIYKKFIEKKQ